MAALVTDSGRKTPTRLAGSAILGCQTDDQLVMLVRSGHERAFEAIVQRYRSSLVRFCGRILPESRCEDAVQQAFISAHASLVASDDAVQLKPWLFTITRNAALNMLRQNGWNYEQIPLDFDGVRQPDQVFEQRIQLEKTVAALNELPERQRDALVMREFEGRSYDEIAVALGANDGAVRQLLNRARVTLRTAAAALIPHPLVMRAAAALPPSDGRGAAEILGGLGAAGIAKASATALVAGTLVVGAVEAPLPVGHKSAREAATLGPAKRHAAARAVRARPDQVKPAALYAAAGRSLTGTSGSRHESRADDSGSGRSGRSGDDGSGDRQHSGSGEGEHSGSGSSGSSGSGSTPGGSGDSGDRSGRSGGSGSGDSQVRAVIESDGTSGGSGSSGSGSTSGGSGSSGSGSGSGDSGSGSTVTSPTSGSGTSGSGTSGSGSSGSGSTRSGSGDSKDLSDH